MDIVDLSDKNATLKYEKLLRSRFALYGYTLLKSKTIQPDPQHTQSVQKGFRIIDKASGNIVAGEFYDLSIEKIEKIWLDEHNRKHTEKLKKRRQAEIKRLTDKKQPKITIIDSRWIVTNDARAVKALEDHIAQYGNFDANGHGNGGDIWSVMYRAYRPYACPQFDRVWPIDGDWNNLTDSNLRSDADETTLPDGVVPITSQRRIWHNEHRIFIKVPIRNRVFFTEYLPELFVILCNTELNDWYIQQQKRKTKAPVKRLYCRAEGKPVAFAELVWLYDNGQIDPSNLTDSILQGKKLLRTQELQVDHLRDNRSNNCAHNVIAIHETRNSTKSDKLTEINIPYYFIPVRVGSTFRVACGKASNNSHRWVVCRTYDEFHDFLEKFHKFAIDAGDMAERYTDDLTKTRCISEMLQDDGQAYHGDQPNPLETLLHMDEGQFTPWDGNLMWLKNKG